MTYTFKLARRIARLRAPFFAALVLALGGCGDANSPTSDTSEGGAIDGPVGAVSFAGGIPIGTFAQPTIEFGSRYNGALRTISPHLLVQELAAIRSRGGKVVVMMAGNQTNYRTNGYFDFGKWKARIDRFKDVNFDSYINDGTIIGHYLIDEPDDPANWNGRLVPPSMVEEMAKYSKQRWPGMPTIVRAEPSYMDKNHRYLDAAWAQYLSRRGSADDYIRRNVAQAQERGLGLVVGLNIIGGGTPNLTKMSASQIESWGRALLSSTYPCAFISWQYNESFLSSSRVKSAMDALRRVAENRSTRTCRGNASAGGQTPTPPPPPSPTPSPPPPPPPTASSGVPFGPSGLPMSQMASFSGALRSANASTAAATASTARQAGTRVILRLAGTDVANRDGTFSLTKWKAALARYAVGGLSSYVSDGTIAGHLLVQNPQSAEAWGGQKISYTTLEEMARYSRQLWPALPTIVQAPTSWLAAKSTPWQYVDASLVTYSGSAGDAGAWVASQASEAGRARLGLLVGMNVLNGGTSASRISGTVKGKFAMSASQLQSWGSALVSQSRVCGLVLSRYDADYFGRSDVKSALTTVAGKAKAHAATSCRVRS